MSTAEIANDLIALWKDGKFTDGLTATLLERANPGAIAARREDAGKLYNVAEFAAEVARAGSPQLPNGPRTHEAAPGVKAHGEAPAAEAKAEPAEEAPVAAQAVAVVAAPVEPSPDAAASA